MEQKVKIGIYREHSGIDEKREADKIIRTCIRTALKMRKTAFPAEINVTLVDAEKIREMNREYRDKDAVTDVLSFPMHEFCNGKPLDDLSLEIATDGRVFLGDVILNVDKAREQGETFGHGFGRECGYLTVHSVLHLLGFDHESGEEDRRLMREEEERILAACGYGK